jgi:signal transduction histidine kinase
MSRPAYATHVEFSGDGTLRRIVVLLRVLGWAWMAALVTLTPSSDAGVDMVVAYGALIAATVWTGATLWASGKSSQLGRPWFVLSDIAVALLVASASTAAGAENFFHGGYPMSTIAVTAYAYNMNMALVTASVVAAHQVVIHAIEDKGLLPAVGSVVFLVFAVIFGWGFDKLRAQERAFKLAQADLDRATDARIRHEERLELANRLHDSVLQTLDVMQRDADDPGQVRYLARRQERQLRRTISEYRSPYTCSTRAELQTVCDEVEDLHRIAIQSVVRGDAECDERLSTLLAATREALMNAAKHGGVDVIDLYAELGPKHVRLCIRDRGHGFDPTTTATGSGLDHSLRRRTEEAGATVTVKSSPGEGTDVEIVWEDS